MNASEQITKHIERLADWRGQVLAQLRKLIRDAAPDVVEEWKWNTPGVRSCTNTKLAVQDLTPGARPDPGRFPGAIGYSHILERGPAAPSIEEHP